MNSPKEIGRAYDPFDWWGWIMAIIGLTLMAYFGGLFGHKQNWWLVALAFLNFWEYAVRVAYGRLYKYIYYDTIIHPMYELDVKGKRYFVNAETEDELELYMQIHYPDLEYTIMDKTHTETFIKTEKFV